MEQSLQGSERMIDREEAVEILSEISEKRYGHQFVLLRMAIEALKQPSVAEILDKISAEIKGRIADCEHGKEIVGDDFGIFAISIQTYSNVLKIIEKYKGVSG